MCNPLTHQFKLPQAEDDPIGGKRGVRGGSRRNGSDELAAVLFAERLRLRYKCLQSFIEDAENRLTDMLEVYKVQRSHLQPRGLEGPAHEIPGSTHA